MTLIWTRSRGAVNASAGGKPVKSAGAVPGVGVKVVNCVPLFGLHHLNAFPVDVWMKRILSNEYPSDYPMERYRPYKPYPQFHKLVHGRTHLTGLFFGMGL